MIVLRIPFGYDDAGFYWPSSPQKRAELMSVKAGSPSDYESTYQCRPGKREGAIFLDDDRTFYDAPVGLPGGIINPDVKTFCSRGYRIIQAWDTAFSQTKGSAYTACVTALLVPCSKWHRDEGQNFLVWGPCEHHFDVYVLDVFREKLDWGDLNEAFRMMYSKWRPEKIIIEKRASGISLFQQFASSDLPIHGVEAKEGKRARAISGTIAGSAQGWFRRHRVAFPVAANWLDAYWTEMKDFTGEDGNISDQVDASVHLITDAINTSSVASMLPTDWSPERIENLPMLMFAEQQKEMMSAARMMNGAIDPRHQQLVMIGEMPNMGVNPFAGTCGYCVHSHVKGLSPGWCEVQNRNVIAFDSCVAYDDGTPSIEMLA